MDRKNEIQKKEKYDISLTYGQSSTKSCIKVFENLVQKVGIEHKRELLDLITRAYFLAVKDCRNNWNQFAGPIAKDSLEEMYNTLKPNNLYKFY